MGVKAVAAVAAGIVVVVAAASPWWCGLRIQEQVEGAIASIPPSPLFGVTLQGYQRHYLGSDALLQLRLTSPGQDPGVFQAAVHIDHGPITGGGIGRARLVATPVLPKELAEALEPVFGKAAPVLVTLDVRLSGDVDGTIASPAAKATAGGTTPIAVDWKGLDAQVHVTSSQTVAKLDGRAPALVLTIPGPDPAAPPVAAVGFEGASLLVDEHRTGADGLWLGHAAFEVARISGHAAGQPSMEIQSLHVASSADSAAGLSLIKGSFGFGKGLFDATVVEDAGLGLSFHDIDDEAMRRFRDSLQDTGAAAAAGTPAEATHALLEKLRPLATPFLARKPWVAIDRFGFTMDGQKVAATAKVQYVGAGDLSAFVPVRDLSGAAHVDVPQALVQRLAVTQQRSMLRRMQEAQSEAGDDTPPMDDAKLDQMAKAAGDATLQEMLQRHWIVAQGDRYVVDASAGDGHVTVNGQAVDLPAPAE